MERIGSFISEHPWLVTVPLAFGAAVSMAFGIYSLFLANDLDNRVAVIEHSPRSMTPSGHECQTIFRTSISAFNPRTVCVLNRKIGLACPPSFRPR